MKRSKPLKPGKRTKEWNRIRARLKPRFEKAGITTCEFGFGGCWVNHSLGFAHADKRRFLKGKQLEEVALACMSCHQILEDLNREQMGIAVRTAITSRERQP